MADNIRTKRYTDEEKNQILRELRTWSGTRNAFYAKHGVSGQSVANWQNAKGDKKKTKGSSKRRPGPYSPEERRQAVEAFLKSGMSLKDFGKVWGVNGTGSLWTWVKIYQEQGPQGLENGFYTKGGKKRGRKGIAPHLRNQITEVKKNYPNFGLKSVRDFLVRFKGLKVSTGTIRKTFKEENISPIVKPKKRRRSADKVRRFERANPMQLWQSDITSYVLTRHSSRVYLTVFMDDCSRYIVAWNLALRQTNELVIDALNDGIQKFGKPEEVLTDQGRQYFSWRGKSDFQKLLDREGVRHVVSRSHHPQTLGKCERFWETVGQEFWERAKPQELSEAKERLTHFINHYNHRRPHQGIDGMIPADRFFGVEKELRQILEKTISENELRLALGETPRSPVFLIGQIGDQSVSMHGEAGKLVIQTPNGDVQSLQYEKFGHFKQQLQIQKGEINDTGNTDSSRINSGASNESSTETG